MENLNLVRRLPSGKSWTEELPDGSVEQSTGSFGYDFGQKVLNIKIMGGEVNLRNAIWGILGYSEVLPVFNPAAAGVQGPYTLNRYIPAKHPTINGLRATKILGCTGRGIDREGPVRLAAGTAGNWEYTYLSILFEIPRYPIMNNADLAGRPEYLRYSLWDYDVNVETLARKGADWQAVAQQARSVTPQFKGDRTLRQAKGLLKITTYDIHEDYVKLGRLIPVNILKRTSTVNARAFPRFSYLDQNKDTALDVRAQFGPGTLLLLPAKISPRTQNHPAVLQGAISPAYFPRTVDVEFSMVHFDPDTDDELFINLQNTTLYGPDPLLIAHETPVRGHQLAPMPAPSGSGYDFYAYVNNAVPFDATKVYTKNGTPVGGNATRHACLHDGKYYSYVNVNPSVPPTPAPPSASWFEGIEKPRALLYPYSDFEKLWAPVESLT